MQDVATRILLIEDNLADLERTREHLASGKEDLFHLDHADNVDQAMRQLERTPFDALLLGVNLPGPLDLDLAGRVHKVVPRLPIVVLSGLDDEELAFKAVQSGAQDYLYKEELSGRMLRRTIQHSIIRKDLEQKATRAVLYDEVTGLPTRTLLYDRWNRSLLRARDHKRWVAVLVVRVQGMSDVIKMLGDEAYRTLVKTLSQRLGTAVGLDDTVARIDDDNFVILLEQINDLEQAERFANGILPIFEQRFALEGEEVLVEARVSIAFNRGDADDDLDELLKRTGVTLLRNIEPDRLPEAPKSILWA